MPGIDGYIQSPSVVVYWVMAWHYVMIVFLAHAIANIKILRDPQADAFPPSEGDKGGGIIVTEIEGYVQSPL